MKKLLNHTLTLEHLDDQMRSSRQHPLPGLALQQKSESVIIYKSKINQQLDQYDKGCAVCGLRKLSEIVPLDNLPPVYRNLLNWSKDSGLPPPHDFIDQRLQNLIL